MSLRLLLINSRSAMSCRMLSSSRKYNGLEVRKYSNALLDTYVPNLKSKYSKKICTALTKCKRNTIIANVCHITTYIKTNSLDHPKLLHSGKKYLICKARYVILLKSLV